MSDCECPAVPADPGTATVGVISIPDLLITVAYFSIPLQLIVAVLRHPELSKKAANVPALILVVLFALFILLCGAGHLLRCLNLGHTTLFQVMNIITATISLVTAVYLIPFVPLLMASFDRIMQTRAQSKAIVEDLYPEPTMRRRFLDSMSAGRTGGVGMEQPPPVTSSRPSGAENSNRSRSANANADADATTNANNNSVSVSGEEETFEPTKSRRRASGSTGSAGKARRRRSSGRLSLGISDLEGMSDDSSSLEDGALENDIKGANRSSNIRAIQNFFQGAGRRRGSQFGMKMGRRRSNDSGGKFHRSTGALSMPDVDIRNDPAGPIAMQFPSCSVMLADIGGFTAWSARSTPDQVFTLLEHVFWEFDTTAREMEVFKLATVGDCYIATCGVPFPREDHAVVLTIFAERCRRRMNDAKQRLAVDHGLEGVEDLNMRFGIHSGPITAGVLRGQKSRFELFGDTINTASRMESTGLLDRIQISSDTAALLKQAGKEDLIVPREEKIQAKGKGELQTYLVKPNLPDDDAAVTGSALSVCHTDINDNDDLMASLRGFDVDGQGITTDDDPPKQLYCKEALDLEEFEASVRSMEFIGSLEEKVEVKDDASPSVADGIV